MTKISLVVAASRNGVVGKDGQMPWYIPSELQRFKSLTMGKPIIMGRKTWDSLPRRPLPGRHNIVLTRDAAFAAEGATIVNSKAAALAAAGDAAEVAVIGGGAVFDLFLPDADLIYFTEVDIIVDGDTHFPALVDSEWTEAGSERVAAEPDRGLPGYNVRKLERRR